MKFSITLMGEITESTTTKIHETCSCHLNSAFCSHITMNFLFYNGTFPKINKSANFY